MPLAAPTAMQVVRRTFLALEALNRRPASTLAMLCHDTGLPKPTLSRLLETLIALDYVTRVSRQLGYRVTDRVLGLSGGIRFVDHLVDAAIGPMDRFTREHGWPLYLGIMRDGAVVIRYSTAPDSPMAFEATGYNRRIPPLTAALGRAYLAFCPEAERRSILRQLGVLEPGAYLEDALERIRRAGFAGTLPPRPHRLHGIAVPILQRGHVLGCLSLRHPKSALTEAQAVARYLPALQQTAAQIAAAAFPAARDS